MSPLLVALLALAAAEVAGSPAALVHSASRRPNQLANINFSAPDNSTQLRAFLVGARPRGSQRRSQQKSARADPAPDDANESPAAPAAPTEPESRAAQRERRARLVDKLLVAYPAARNLELVETLRRRGLDFRVFYPRRQVQGAGAGARTKRLGERPAAHTDDELGADHESDEEIYAVSTRTSGHNGGAERAAARRRRSGPPSQISSHYNRTNIVIKAFNYKFRLDLELNTNLFGPSLIQKHFLPNGAKQISTQPIEHCFYHAHSQPSIRPRAVGAFKTCSGLSGIIHVDNESFVIHPFYDAELSRKHPHIIYRYQASGADSASLLRRECGNLRLHEWAFRQHNRLPSTLHNHSRRAEAAAESPASCGPSGQRAPTAADQANDCDSERQVPPPPPPSARFAKRDVSLTEKHIELALVLSQDMYEKRNSSSKLEVLHDAMQIVNCLDLYFRSANTRVALIYVETWAHGDQIELSANAKQTLYNFLDYSTRKLFKVAMDASHLLTGGHARRFEADDAGMSIPNSICSSRAVGVSQDASVFEPFVAAATLAHMLGHNLGMEHDEPAGQPLALAATVPTRPPEPQRGAASPSAGAHEERDEDEGELRSRSVGEAEGGPEADEDGEAGQCRANCLMGERFVYRAPPVSIESMAPPPPPPQNQSEPSAHPTPQLADQIDIELASGGATAGANLLPFRFSRQSVETYHRLLRLGHGICLFNKPNQLEDFKSCGNGIVDKGEDCDCGTFQECAESDSCCDPVTCRFKVDAECIAGACCERCRLRPRGFVCRKSRGECDLPELCDGKSGQCAPDVYRHNGHPCAANSSYCYLGQCPTYDGQCAEIWGSDARRSERLCYSSMNTNGTARGNCGFDAALRKYRRCEAEHMMCGTLQCQAGDMKPVTAAAAATAEFSKKVLHAADRSAHECKAITSALAAANSLSYVRDGTKCAQGRVCLNQTCRPVEQVHRDAFELCPRDDRGRQCSGNGVCSTAHRCHCDPDWSGHDCSQQYVAPPASRPADSTRDAPVTPPADSPPSEAPSPVSPTQALVRAQTNATPVASESPPTSTSASTSTSAAPSPAGNGTSNVAVLDKKKHDALGAPTLVFILVTIVAAVYLGFALMANCYRRKNFYKPDKVLRHHQMNCKLDAIRSSFIAKRLADAEIVLSNGGNLSACNPLLEGAPPAAGPNGVDLLSPFVSPLSAQTNFHQAPLVPQPPPMHQPGPAPQMSARHMRPQQPLVGYQGHAPHQIAASVHYFEEADGQPVDCVHQRMGAVETLGFEAPSGDHIPLLVGEQRNQRPTNQRMLRTFNGHPGNSAFVARKVPLATDFAHQTQLINPQASANLQRFGPINRAISLGSVNHKHTPGEHLDGDDNETRRRAMATHRALATPLRTSGAGLESLRGSINGGHYRRANFDDSCSAPSSPEHRYQRHYFAEHQRPVDLVVAGLGRHQHQRPLHQHLQHSDAAGGFHDDVILTALSGQQADGCKREISLSRQHSINEIEAKTDAQLAEEEDDGDADDERLPPLPPPPQHLDELNGSDTDSEQARSSVRARLHRTPTGKTPTSERLPAGYLLKSLKRIPSVSQSSAAQPQPYIGHEQLSLIAQLQKLEQVQSLHQQKRVVAGTSLASAANPETLHEFFSLPLSVQLSALLARSLNENREFSLTSIDDVLNNLNNSSVATMSRKNFKSAGQSQAPKQEQASASRGGTLKRQQAKLQNLQSLINRLQKLHNQTVIQQQLEELNDQFLDDNENLTATSGGRSGSRNSTLGRSSRAHSVSKASGNSGHPMGANDDSFDVVGLQNRGARRSIVRARPPNSKSPRHRPSRAAQESIYSMSDSEDGLFVSRVLNTYQLQRQSSKSPKQGDETGASRPAGESLSREFPRLDDGSSKSGGNEAGGQRQHQAQQQVRRLNDDSSTEHAIAVDSSAPPSSADQPSTVDSAKL